MLKTEMRNPRTTHIDKMSTAEMVNIMTDENFRAVEAVKAAAAQIGEAVDAVTASFENNGRLFLIGAGTSGRLGVLDAAECPPTFGVSSDMVTGIIAGGAKCMFAASEGEEDNEQKGRADIIAHNISKHDCVVGISAAGNAAYVVGALSAAREIGATTIALCCNRGCKIEAESDICICTDTGPEVITGSTRLKAGTAHKMVLNIITTCSMTKIGNVYENMMINLKPSNQKLRQRMINIVCEICGCDAGEAEQRLEEHGWKIREAVS